MTDESKTDDIEAKLATLRGRNELSNAKLDIGQGSTYFKYVLST
jgi:hypothetical protein